MHTNLFKDPPVHGHLLTGTLYDEAGEKLRAVRANKQGVRYRYYVSRHLVEGRKKDTDGWRLPANEVDSVVEHQLIQILHDRTQLTDGFGSRIGRQTSQQLSIAPLS